MSNWKNILVWFGIVAYLTISLSFVSKKQEESYCQKIEFKIVDFTENRFVHKADIVKKFQESKLNIVNHKLKNINKDQLEDILYKIPAIKNVEVFLEESEVLKVEVEQRNPIVRIINSNNESYYIDENGLLMELSKNYTAHVVIVNGNINKSFSKNKLRNLAKNEKIEITAKMDILKDIYTLAKFINEDDVWKSLVEQIYITKKGDFELIPKIGSQTIILGTVENYQEKFRKLKALYQIGFPKTSWNKYKTINLKYKDQAVCTKK